MNPGNAGTKLMPNITNLDSNVDPVNFAKENSIDLVIIGPEAPLVDGMADRFRDAGLAVVGPSAVAAQLESSKSFACDFMERHDIAYPKSYVAHSLEEFTDTDATSVVLKADGLAGGKGVILPSTIEEAKNALGAMFSGDYDGAGENGVVIQERLSGPEVSAFALSDGNDYVLLPFAQDHKRLKDGDMGPNTGGMGAYAPVPDSIVSPAQYEKINDIAKKTIEGMKADGEPYKGILYIGVMLAQQRDGDPVVIEYNVRFGDPEAEVVLTILADAGVDVYSLLKSTDSTINKSLLGGITLSSSALTICLAAPGYPEAPRKGDEILGLDTQLPAGVFFYHAGTKNDNGKVVTNGGRVMYVTAVADNIDEAASSAYSIIGESGVHFDNMQYRKDIGKQARKMQ
jgi:phosphoribosylamine--glycine ligase